VDVGGRLEPLWYYWSLKRRGQIEMTGFKKRLRIGVLVAPLAMLVAAHSLAQSPMTRTVLKRVDLGGDATREIIVARLELRPGAHIPRHIHHGDEVVHVLTGGAAKTAGGKTIQFKQGMVIHFPRATPHAGFTATSNFTVITVHIVDKGKPLLVPVK
jgi:quercetin dioxygenase-like cupin family protein